MMAVVVEVVVKEGGMVKEVAAQGAPTPNPCDPYLVYNATTNTSRTVTIEWIANLLSHLFSLMKGIRYSRYCSSPLHSDLLSPPPSVRPSPPSSPAPSLPHLFLLSH